MELQNVLMWAYEEMCTLKQHVMLNKVMQDHLYALHNQVKHTVQWVCKASLYVDRLIGVTLKQMTLNVDAVQDFSTILHSIPFDALYISDFYRSIRSFYVRLMECYVKFYGKNNPFIINMGHAFKNFLQKCDYVEPLPKGITQFTGMMVSIIHDVYNIDVKALMHSVQEMRSKPDPVKVAKPPVDKPKPVLDNEELKELA